MRLHVLADEADRGFERRAWPEDGCDALRFEEFGVLFGDGSSENYEYIAGAALSKQGSDARHDRVMRSGEDAQADAVHVFLNGSVRDHLRRLAQAGVDDLHPRVAQGTGDDFRSSVMAVETGLSYEDANGCGAILRHELERIAQHGQLRPGVAATYRERQRNQVPRAGRA